MIVINEKNQIDAHRQQQKDTTVEIKKYITSKKKKTKYLAAVINPSKREGNSAL